MADIEVKNNDTPPTHAEQLENPQPLPHFRVGAAGDIHFTWPEWGLIVDVERITSDGRAELTFWHDTGEFTRLLHHARANLLSTSAMQTIGRRLAEYWDHIGALPWAWVLTCVSHGTVKHSRQGEEAAEIWPREGDTLKPEYLLEPILYLNHPSVIFGDYGSLKSLVALVVGLVAQLPITDNGLGFTTREDAAKVLYLDWEDDATSFRKRWGALLRGFGMEAAIPILYKRMTTPLSEATEAIQKIIAEKGVRLLILDSLGPAARGNLNDSEPAIGYNEALRKIGVTSLTLAHCAKDQLTRKRSIFGSVFFSNLARSVWECKADQEPGDDEARVILKNSKANLSGLSTPLGYRFLFGEDTIKVSKADLSDTNLAGELPLSVRIKDILRHGAMPVKDIAEALDAKEVSVRGQLNRDAKKAIVVKVGDSWGIIQTA